MGSRTIHLWTIPPGNCPLDNCTLENCFRTSPSKDNCPPDNSHLGQFPPQTIRTLDNCPVDNCPLETSHEQFHIGLLICPRIITTRRLLPRAMTITNYNFFMAIFCVFSMTQLYNSVMTTKIIMMIVIRHGVSNC